MNKKILIISSNILGILFILVALLYWSIPAGSLPSFVPGFTAGSAAVHIKHGVASLFLGLALFVFAWFKGGKN